MIRLSGGKERRADFGDASIEPETYETVDIDFDDYDCDSSEKSEIFCQSSPPAGR